MAAAAEPKTEGYPAAGDESNEPALATTGDEDGEDDGVRDVFMCCQQTQAVLDKTKAWLGDDKPLVIKASLPKFNKKIDKMTGIDIIAFDTPCFGPKLTRTVLGLFTHPLVQETARHFKVQVPIYTINKIVQDRMKRAKNLVEEATKLQFDATAIGKLSDFIDAVIKLTPGQFSTSEEWYGFVNQFVAPGWEDKMHMNSVLSNFGFPPDECKALNDRRDTEQDTIGQGFRWLSKGFDCFGFPGSLADVVNMVFAMLNQQPGRPGQGEVVAIVEDFQQTFCNVSDWKRLWVPTHMIHDAEYDDMASWLLVQSIHYKRMTTLQVMIQLPVGDPFDEVERKLTATTAIEAFRDADSTNAQNVTQAAKMMFGI